MEDFIKLFGMAVFGSISTEDFLIECGMSPEEAKEMIEEINKQENGTD